MCTSNRTWASESEIERILEQTSNTFSRRQAYNKTYAKVVYLVAVLEISRSAQKPVAKILILVVNFLCCR